MYNQLYNQAHFSTPRFKVYDSKIYSFPESDPISQSSNISNNHINSTWLVNQSLSTGFNLSQLDQSAANNNGNNITNHINSTNGEEFDFPVLSSRLSSFAHKSNRRRSGAVGQDGYIPLYPNAIETGRLLLFLNSFCETNSRVTGR